ncbi:15280_t:CDS:2, partial [Racocetra persica]
APDDVEILHENIEAVTLEKSQSFDNFDLAEKHVQNYTEYIGFKIVIEYSTVIETAENERDHEFVEMVKTYLARVNSYMQQNYQQ